MQAGQRSYLDVLRQRVLVFDGSMGANLQELNPTADDFGGPQYEGCMDALCVAGPELPRRLHEGFLQVGCDVVETNTFQASRLRLSEWGLADATLQINRAGAQLARRVCDEFEAQRALQIGLVQEVVPAGQQVERALEIAHRIARNAPIARLPWPAVRTGPAPGTPP